MENIKGKVVAITGASNGMGKAIAIALAKNGAKAMDQIAVSPEAIANAVLYAVSQPEDVEVGDIIIRPAAQN